jgi:hypothetical protein
MSSPTESPAESSSSDILFAAAVVIVCLLALALSVHVFRGRRFHHGAFAVNIHEVDPVRPMALSAV